MGKFSNIAWTDHTFNFWIGCTEASAHGCATCYAREQDKRYQWGVPSDVAKENRAAGIAPHWGAGAPRHRTSEANWKKPFVWDAEARQRGIVYKVFTSSLSDLFDNEVAPEWRRDAWEVIRATTSLRWIILTKRVPNIRRMLPRGWGNSGFPNAGLVASVVTQQEMNRDAPRLLSIPARWHGFSMEPQVEHIELPKFSARSGSVWVITGGDSAQPTSKVEPRPYDVAWARSLIGAGRDSRNVSVFVKQLGAKPIGAPPQTDAYAGENTDDWPADLRVRQFPPDLLS